MTRPALLGKIILQGISYLVWTGLLIYCNIAEYKQLHRSDAYLFCAEFSQTDPQPPPMPPPHPLPPLPFSPPPYMPPPHPLPPLPFSPPPPMSPPHPLPPLPFSPPPPMPPPHPLPPLPFSPPLPMPLPHPLPPLPFSPPPPMPMTSTDEPITDPYNDYETIVRRMLRNTGDTADYMTCVTRFSATCCTSFDYVIAYQIVNVVAGTMAILQTMHLLSEAVYALIVRLPITNFVYLFETHIKLLLVTPLSIGFAYFYQYCVYHLFQCGKDAMFCRIQPSYHNIFQQVFLSVLVFAIVSFILHAVQIAVFGYIFYTKHAHTWHSISRKENTLLLTDVMRSVFDAHHVLQKTFDVRHFLRIWSWRTDEDIMSELENKADMVFSDLCSYLDGKEDIFITREEFSVFTSKLSVIEQDLVWEMLTANHTHAYISHESLEDVLYDLNFQKKLLAFEIKTDVKSLNYMMLYLSFFLYPICGIITTKIFGYSNAFGQGIDLFKSYVAITSFVFTKVGHNVKFVLSMLFKRPYKIGDVLSIQDEIYEVKDFDTFHTMLSGSTALLIPNTMLVQDKIVNLTKSNMTDTFDITFPLHSITDDIDIYQFMQDYMSIHKRDILESSVTCCWIQIDVYGKQMRCTWKYKFSILDRKRLQDVRYRVKSWIVQNCHEKSVPASFRESSRSDALA